MNWFLILSLIFGSASLAILGDILGFKYGKQRISLFGLRPKYTSRLITAITGGMIAVIVLGVLSVFSQDVRTALFSMKYIRQQIFDLRLQLNESQNTAFQAQSDLALQQEQVQIAAASLDLTRLDLESLRNDKIVLEQEKRELEDALQAIRDESERLKTALKTMRNDAIAFSANILLAQTAFDFNNYENISRDEIISRINNLKQQVRLSVMARMADAGFSASVEFDADEEAALIDELINNFNKIRLESQDIPDEDFGERFYVRALSLENTPLGENVKVRFEIGESKLIYENGDIIYRKMFNAQDENFDPEQTLHIFLRSLRIQALDDGVLPDPATHNVGTLGGEAFFEAVNALHSIHEPVIINAVASGDIYTEGPVNVQIDFQE